MDRVAELAREVRSEADRKGVARVESIDAMPLLWKIDDGLIAMDAMPASPGTSPRTTMRKAIKNVDLTGNNALDRRRITVRSADAKGLSRPQRSARPKHPSVRGDLDRRPGQDHGPGRSPEVSAEFSQPSGQRPSS